MAIIFKSLTGALDEEGIYSRKNFETKLIRNKDSKKYCEFTISTEMN